MMFLDALARKNTGRPPVWFMRQAGRYHSHYMAIRARHTFMEMCKVPQVARDITFGPLEEFGFDAAILFSDLLFPLEALGMGLEYTPGPKLGWHLKTKEDLRRLTLPSVVNGTRASFMEFQAAALKRIRADLPSEKGLIGFVGGPWTLFCYAVDGSHAGGLEDSKRGLTDGRYAGFLEALIPLLADNMILQARAGAHAVAIFDTCGGEVDAETYGRHVVPALGAVLERFRSACPETPVIYYSKKTDPAHWAKLDGLPFQCLGVDWRHDLLDVLRDFGDKYAIQGNMDPQWITLPEAECEAKARAWMERIAASGMDLSGWICGLGHGCTPQVKEANVMAVIQLQHEIFGGRGR
jgi:uroporphyrinogen decarboxylase